MEDEDKKLVEKAGCSPSDLSYSDRVENAKKNREIGMSRETSLAKIIDELKVERWGLGDDCKSDVKILSRTIKRMSGRRFKIVRMEEDLRDMKVPVEGDSRWLD